MEEKYPGIYYIKGGMLFPVQIIVTKRLDPKHAGLRILSNHAQEQDVRRFLEEAEKMKNPGDRKNIDAVLQVSATANRELYKKIREDSIMCEALRELMKDELAEERKEGIKEGIKEGLINSIKNLMDTMSLSVEQAMDALKIPANNREMYLSIITGLNKNS